MCHLCLEGINNPFSIRDTSRDNIDSKKFRAKEIKDILRNLEMNSICDEGQKEIVKLKEEQYKLAREI